MTRRSIGAAAALALIVCSAGSARAEDGPVPDRGFLIVNLGAGAGTGKIHYAGASSEGPAFTAGFDLNVRIHGPLAVGVQVGGLSVSGWLLAADVRAEAHPTPHLFLSVGAGPALVATGALSDLVFLQTDATLSLRSAKNLALLFGPVVSFAMNHAGTPGCGVDTCNAWAVPGDRLILVRFGLGAAF